MKYDVLTNTEESLSIEIINGKINSYRNKNITKKGVRLFENNKIYTTSFVGDIADSDLVKKAQATKSVGIPYQFELPQYQNFKEFDKDENLNRPLNSIEKAIEETQKFLSEYSSQYVFNGKFVRSIYSNSLKDDQGRVLERKFAHNEWHYVFKKIGSPNLIDGYFEEDGCSLDVNDVLEKNRAYLEAYKNEIDFKNGRYPVLFIDSGELLYKLSESLRAEKYCEGSALYSGKLNQKIFNDKFSLFDMNYSPAHSLYRQYDSEGVMRKINNLPLIENGVMKNIIADLRTAKKYGVEATGNGVRTYDSAVSTGFNSLVMGKGSRTTAQILKSLNECIVVFMGHGGDFTDKGDFSTPLHLSYLVKNGEIIGRLPQLTVNTSTQDMFGSRFIEIASDGFQKNKLQPSLFTEMDVVKN